jgi:hypothetical protein
MVFCSVGIEPKAKSCRSFISLSHFKPIRKGNHRTDSKLGKSSIGYNGYNYKIFHRRRLEKKP